MFYVLTNSSKPIGELGWGDVGFRKVNNEVAALFVATSVNGANRYIDAANGNGVMARELSSEEIQVLQMNLSSDSVRFVFEVFDPISGRPAHHATIHTIH
jgi:hypothetical protein